MFSLRDNFSDPTNRILRLKKYYILRRGSEIIPPSRHVGNPLGKRKFAARSPSAKNYPAPKLSRRNQRLFIPNHGFLQLGWENAFRPATSAARSRLCFYMVWKLSRAPQNYPAHFSYTKRELGLARDRGAVAKKKWQFFVAPLL